MVGQPHQDSTLEPLGSRLGGFVPPGLFGGLDLANQGLSLLQQIHDASVQGDDVGVDQFGQLILPSSGPPAGPPAVPYTANPFLVKEES